MDKYKSSKILPASLSMSELPILKKTIGSVFGTALGTAALVSIHHHYRKQRHPNAHPQDYLIGLESQLKSLRSTQSKSSSQLTRLQYACQQAAKSWQQAYQSYEDQSYDNQYKAFTELAALHTTTMLARPVCWVSGVASMPKNMALISDRVDDDVNENDNGFGVVGIDVDRQIVWQTTMPERVHDIVVQPTAINENNEGKDKSVSRHVVVMGRRPSAGFWVLDTATGQVQQAIKAATERHFYGHACYSLDGSKLYVTENDTMTLAGKIGIYDAKNNYKKVAEFDSHGIGPHELIMHPDGETLVIANGGIKTEQASREELNLDSMRPSLVYLNRHDGALLEQIVPEHNQMSIRHLAMHDNGTVMIGIQFQGEKHINTPLVLTHNRGDTNFTSLTMPNNQWQRFHQYIASVAVDSQHNLLCVTTPIGGCAAIYDLNTLKLIDDVRLPDCAGASILKNNTDDNDNNHKQSGFIVSDGQGQLTTLIVNNAEQTKHIIKDSQVHKMSFDNHLQAL